MSAACAGQDPRLWFAEDNASIATAKAICGGCPIRQQCLDEALAREGDVGPKSRHGIYGGLTPGERAGCCAVGRPCHKCRRRFINRQNYERRKAERALGAEFAAELRAAHAAYARGERTPGVVAAERTYQRLRKRGNRKDDAA